ncbi:MAG: hypothetical protein ACI9J0_000657 [Cryomorphaceae bacterium]
MSLPYESSAGFVWPNDEKKHYWEIWKTEVVTNSSAPTLSVLKVGEQIANETSVIIAPEDAPP